jgi:hypothetical protein
VTLASIDLASAIGAAVADGGPEPPARGSVLRWRR